MARLAVIDSQVAGIAGDMLASALVDAGANQRKIIDAIFVCQDFLKGSKISGASFARVKSHGFAATQLRISFKDSVRERRGVEMHRALARCCDSIELEPRAKLFALESFKTIISAEAKVHGDDFSKVHLHEASSIDTFADLVGSAVALQDLGLFDARIFSTKVAVGGGLLKFSHGTIPNPGSAILEIFKGKRFVLVGGQADAELTTPTGAAMLVNLAAEGSINYYPSIAAEKIGYGSGTRHFEGFPNVVRVLIGSSTAITEANRDSVCVVETNVDDASGELVGNLVEQLADIARDVTVIPGLTKKSRPVYLIRIISEREQLNDVLDKLFAESGALGARVQEVERFVLPRAVLTVPVKINKRAFKVRVKVARKSSGTLTSAKPEFEDIKLIASRSKMSVKRTMELVNAQVVQQMGRISR